MNKFKPTKSEKVVITIRIENKRVEELDKLAAEIDISRNELINQCLEYALKDIELKNINETKNDN